MPHFSDRQQAFCHYRNCVDRDVHMFKRTALAATGSRASWPPLLDTLIRWQPWKCQINRDRQSGQSRREQWLRRLITLESSPSRGVSTRLSNTVCHLVRLRPQLL